MRKDRNCKREEREIMRTIYKPDGRAKEYGELALNIYTGCTHGCTYCYAEKMAKQWGKPFRENVCPRDGIVEATKKELATGKYKDKLIHLCFTCDPYPANVDTTATREIIQAIKKAGAHVQILTKGGSRAARDFDLLDENDWFGVTISGGSEEQEPNTDTLIKNLDSLYTAWNKKINTWVSCEPVFNTEVIYNLIKYENGIDLYKIGKLNYEKSDIDWGVFGRECERLCRFYNRNYYIKEDLRKLM